MIRRTRRTKEIPFSFDSFLDVVANVVGIIIRLILVVWVGARSYNTIQPMLGHHAASEHVAADVVLPADPLQDELLRNNKELEEMKTKLLEQLRDLQITEEQEHAAETRLEALANTAQSLETEKSKVALTVDGHRKLYQGAELTMASLQERRKKLMDEIQALEKLPPLKKVLRYRTPVSQLLKTDEFFFECIGGRVTFVDIASLKALAEREAGSRMNELRTNRQITGTTLSEGAFRLQYSFTAAGDDGGRSEVKSDLFVEPVSSNRGEALAAALATNSQFRQVVDRLDPKLAAVTFWVYPDSFAAFRQLRDYLYEKEIVVAGRPLPEGAAITLSTHGGSASRGQ